MSNLTTLAKVKTWLGIASANTTDDALLTEMVSAYSEYIQTWLGRSILAASYTESRDGSGQTLMPFANYPVTAVSSVSVNGVTIPVAASVTGPGYRFTSTMLILNGYTFAPGYGNVQITYTAGYAAVPPELDRATCELVAMRYREKDRIGMTSKTLSGEIVSFITDDFSKSIKTILNNYKKVIPV